MKRQEAEKAFYALDGAVPRAFAFPWSQVQIFEVFISQGMLAVVVPRLAVGIVQDDGMLQLLGMGVVPFSGKRFGVPVKSVLHVPFQRHESFVLVKQAI